MRVLADPSSLMLTALGQCSAGQCPLALSSSGATRTLRQLLGLGQLKCKSGSSGLHDFSG